jgi:hypothetical protein
MIERVSLMNNNCFNKEKNKKKVKENIVFNTSGYVILISMRKENYRKKNYLQSSIISYLFD